eukprot:TRINITY_DN32340_c0_g1_i1.p1 TRINITY_DN32340_c0_g1~~TRINITY_DN32340_c0_g1_i1.p1  ORF type:complete len:457 (-),score=34.81 TRINITY_DN32340_c0_g1_i1:98-1429(-)
MPKYGDVQTDFKDSCGTTFPDNNILKIGGGAPWKHAYEAADKAGFQIVGGGGQTVSAAGGWLQGGGLSALSRNHGLGVDNVVKFDLILANGTEVSVDKCSQPDLFWALRGGGGGTYGIVLAAYYRMHPKQPVVRLYAEVKSADTSKWGAVGSAGKKMGDLWLQESPNLDKRWGGYWSGTLFLLTFQGSRAEADQTFLNKWEQVKDTFTENEREVLITSVEEKDSYWESVGKGATTDPTGAEDFPIAARLVPRDWVIANPDKARELMDKARLHGSFNYVLGGAINEVAVEDTAVHPAMRKAVWNIIGGDPTLVNYTRTVLPNSITGACYNHASQTEPDWHEAFWSSNLGKLEQIKKSVDPDNRFNCYHCVGYTGPDETSTRTNTTTPYCKPDDSSCWPTEDDWDALGATLGGSTAKGGDGNAAVRVASAFLAILPIALCAHIAV